MALAEATDSTSSAAAEPDGPQPGEQTDTVFDEFPLTGCVVAVTADRRRDDLASLLRRRGAKVIETPTLRLVPLDDDAALRKATNDCLSARLDYAVATTGSGWRGWMSAAESWGLGEELTQALSGAVIVSRGAKATGAVRAAGMRESYSAPSESSEELLTYLLAQGVVGKRVVVQQYGVENPAEDTRFVTALRDAGAIVVDIPVYRWGPPSDRAAVRRLVDAIVRREVHAVSFTSAPGVTALLEAAAVTGALDQLLVALRTDVTAVCVGPVCARPLEALDVNAIWPERARLGAMVATLCSVLPPRIRHEVPIDQQRTLTLQGLAAVVSGREPVILAPLPAAVLAELGRRPGWVVSRADLLRRVWGPRGAGTGGRDEHAVEATVARLRAALGPDSSLIKTVTKRGYRLAVEPQ
jgi:uroporphyrinogen-III synthase